MSELSNSNDIRGCLLDLDNDDDSDFIIEEDDNYSSDSLDNTSVDSVELDAPAPDNHDQNEP